MMGATEMVKEMVAASQVSRATVAIEVDRKKNAHP
jgi:hypothetical protein